MLTEMMNPIQSIKCRLGYHSGRIYPAHKLDENIRPSRSAFKCKNCGEIEPMNPPEGKIITLEFTVEELHEIQTALDQRITQFSRTQDSASHVTDKLEKIKSNIMRRVNHNTEYSWINGRNINRMRTEEDKE